MIETVKKAEVSDAVILRLYEAHGTRGPVRLSSSLPVRSISRCNLLEEEDAPMKWSDGGVDFDITPFKIMTFKINFAK
jgi:alpha-mannosidase